VTAPTPQRLVAVERAIHRLPEPANELFRVILHDNAADFLLGELHQPDKPETEFG
jgi:hypothetical protein